jgi:hypothetical protein
LSGYYLKNLASIIPHVILLSIIPIDCLLKERFLKRKHLIINLIIIFAFFSASVGIISHFSGVERSVGFYGGYFNLAGLMAFTIPITFGKYLSTVSGQKWYYFTNVILQSVALWWTFTRSAYLAVILGFCLWMMVLFFYSFKANMKVSPEFFKPILNISLIPFLFVILIITSSDPRINPFQDKNFQKEATIDSPDFSSGRKSIIDDAINITCKEFREGDFLTLIFGHGLQSRQILVDSPFTSWESDYLQAFMNQGIIGLLIIILMYFLLIKVVINRINDLDFQNSALAVSGIGIFVMSFLTQRMISLSSGGLFVILYLLLTTEKNNYSREEPIG